jgi:hypothetical protein
MEHPELLQFKYVYFIDDMSLKEEGTWTLASVKSQLGDAFPQ